MRIVVTGAAGQLGTAIVQRLAHEPWVDQIVTVDLAPLTARSPKIDEHRLDIRDPAVERLLEGADALLHLAFVVLGFRPRGEFDAINVGGSRRLFEAAARQRVPYLLYTSSVAAYGVLPGHPDPIDESTPRRFQPNFPYAAAKYDVETLLDAFEVEHPSVRVTRLRPAIVIGPGSKGPTENSLRRRIWVKSTEHGMPIVWEDDVAQAALLALQRRAHGAFVLAADDPLPGDQLAAAAGFRCVRMPPSLRRALARAVEAAGPDKRPDLDPGWMRFLDVKMRFSSRKAREELGWRPVAPTCVEVLRRYDEVMPRADESLPQRALVALLQMAQNAAPS